MDPSSISESAARWAATRSRRRHCARTWAAEAVVAGLLGVLLALLTQSPSWAQDEPTADAGEGIAPPSGDESDPFEEFAEGEGTPVGEPSTGEGQPLVTSSADPFGFVVADSELVYGPSLYGFDTAAFADERAGYLSTVYETVGVERLRGPDIVQRVAEEYGVGPRVLLTLLELRSGWVTTAAPAERFAPLDGETVGLQAGLSAAADALSAAYYAKKSGGLSEFELADGAVAFLPDVNPGTFAVMAWLGKQTAPEVWAGLELPSRFVMTWNRLFGDPLTYDISGKRPAMTAGPSLAVPIPPGELWYYVQGPHAPAGTGAPWAAVDFAPPPPEAAGCAPSISWVNAVANGTVVVSRAGTLVLDLDEDGFAGSGWAHVYRHLWSGELAPAGRFVRAGERLGHPSCDGGAAAPARVMFARTYDGDWIDAANATAPLRLGSWIAVAGATEGSGQLVGAEFAPRRPSPSKLAAVNGVFAAP